MRTAASNLFSVRPQAAYRLKDMQLWLEPMEGHSEDVRGIPGIATTMTSVSVTPVSTEACPVYGAWLKVIAAPRAPSLACGSPQDDGKNAS
jgi:hypothetical protein